MYDFISSHGDGVQDIAIEVQDIESIVRNSMARGGKLIQPITEKSDAFGTIKEAKVWAFGD